MTSLNTVAEHWARLAQVGGKSVTLVFRFSGSFGSAVSASEAIHNEPNYLKRSYL